MMKHFPDHDLYVCGDDHFAYSKVVREHIEQLPTKNAYLTGKISAEEKVWLRKPNFSFLYDGRVYSAPRLTVAPIPVVRRAACAVVLFQRGGQLVDQAACSPPGGEQARQRRHRLDEEVHQVDK